MTGLQPPPYPLRTHGHGRVYSVLALQQPCLLQRRGNPSTFAPRLVKLSQPLLGGCMLFVLFFSWFFVSLLSYWQPFCVRLMCLCGPSSLLPVLSSHHALKGRSCKFSGPDCPFSHGVEVSMSDLLPDDDNRDWEACSPAATPASAAAAAADDDDDSDDGVAAAAWLPKDQQAGTDGGNDGKAKAATDASHGSGTAGSGTTGSGSGTAKKTTGGAWLADLRSGSRVLARFHDRVWYEATAEGPVTAGKQISVRFRGFEDDGALYVPANSSHLAPLEVVNGSRRGRRRGRGEGGPGASSDSGGGEEGEGKESDLEDAWADAAAGSGDGDTFSAERFFQERVLGDRREVAGGSGGGGSGGGGGSSGTAGGGGDGREGGLCSDAYVFGGWEQHTKGFGSRMMNRMGYRRGEGLGKEKQVKKSQRREGYKSYVFLSLASLPLAVQAAEGKCTTEMDLNEVLFVGAGVGVTSTTRGSGHIVQVAGERETGLLKGCPSKGSGLWLTVLESNAARLWHRVSSIC